MRIAQVAPLYESVPPLAYGGTERVISHLTEELVGMGHHVTLFASGDSATAAELVPVHPRAIWRDATVWDTLTHHVRELELVARQADRFDVIHFHCEMLHLPLITRLRCRHLTTFHGRLLPADHGPFFRLFERAPLTSISNDQRRPIPWANWQATVYHGLPPSQLPYQPTSGDYLLFLGRIMREKRPDLAIEIARRAGLPLKMAAKVFPGEQEYFAREIEPLLKDSRTFVDYLGEVGGPDRTALLANARALLFPIDWPEPFGLVLIEALACGTPVIAFRNGAVPEIVEDGISGFVVDGVDAAVDSVGRIDQLSRAACRRAFERRFTAARMAHDYVAVYERLLAPGADSAS